MITKLTYTMPNVFQLSNVEKACFGKDAWSITNLRAEFVNQFSHFFADVRDGQIVGYVCVRIMYEEAQVCNIAVLPQYRRQGIATQLIDTMVQFALQQKCLRCELEVNTANTPAVELYRKCLFEQVGLRPIFYRRSRYPTRDAYTMVRTLVTPDEPAEPTEAPQSTEAPQPAND